MAARKTGEETSPLRYLDFGVAEDLGSKTLHTANAGVPKSGLQTPPTSGKKRLMSKTLHTQRFQIADRLAIRVTIMLKFRINRNSELITCYFL